jgi:hypothetical protein
VDRITSKEIDRFTASTAVPANEFGVVANISDTVRLYYTELHRALITPRDWCTIQTTMSEEGAYPKKMCLFWYDNFIDIIVLKHDTNSFHYEKDTFVLK